MATNLGCYGPSAVARAHGHQYVAHITHRDQGVLHTKFGRNRWPQTVVAMDQGRLLGLKVIGIQPKTIPG